jgi:hypothetical protein
MKNKVLFILCCFWAVLVCPSCSDWTESESLAIIEPDIREQNPELYARYLENLKKYRQSDHKAIYAWFDNSVKEPFNRAQHIDCVPDSIDVIVLMHPDGLVDRELAEMQSVRQDKGTKVIFSIDYDAIKLNYNDTDGSKEFIAYLIDTLQYSLKLVDKYGYDGISVGYKGKSLLHMEKKEKEEYILNENACIGIINSWMASHQDKMVVFEGKPQNLTNKAILNACRHIIIPTAETTTGALLSYNIALACVQDVPVDRFVVTAAAASLDKADTKTGFWTDGSRAITSSAVWAAATYPGFVVAGLGIYNINNDYYNTQRVYDYTKKAINTLNPSF